MTPTVHFDAILQKRGGTAVPARKIGQPGVGITPKTTGSISNLFDQLKNCDQVITPACLRALYGLVYQPLSGDRNSYAIGLPTFCSHKYTYSSRLVEYTPQAYLQSDLDMFNRNFSQSLVGASPTLVSIDGGWLSAPWRYYHSDTKHQNILGVIQTEATGFEYNGESNLDLQYAINLVNLKNYKQKVTLYQVGDIPQGQNPL